MIVDQVVSWLRNNWFFALIGLILGAIVWLARASNAIRDIISNWRSITKSTQEPIKFNPEDLERETNPRFGFSFLYSKTWDREDPMNANGNTFVDPKNPEVRMSTWGAYGVVWPTLEELVSEILKDAGHKPGYRLIRNVESGRHMIAWQEREGTLVEFRRQIEGRRLQYQYIEGRKRKTVVEVLTEVEDKQFGVCCEAPSHLYPAYEDLFLALLAGLRVLGR